MKNFIFFAECLEFMLYIYNNIINLIYHIFIQKIIFKNIIKYIGILSKIIFFN